MTYRDNVEHAAAALERGEDANWELARLTFENTYEAGRVSTQTDRVSMADWCADVRVTSGRKFSDDSGVLYKRIWRRYGPYVGTDHAVSWSDAYEACKPEREPTAPTVEATAEPDPQDPARYRPLRDQIDVASDEAKRYAFRRLAQEPAVIQEAADIGSPVSRAVTGLEQKADSIREQRLEQAVQADPVAVRLEQQSAAVDVMGECNRVRRDLRRFAEAIEELLPKVGKISEGDLFWIREALSDAHATLDRLSRLVDTGQTDLDTFLDSVLTGERDAQH